MFKKISILLFVTIFSGNLYGEHIIKTRVELKEDNMNKISYSYLPSGPQYYDKFEVIGDDGKVYGSATVLKNPDYEEWKKNNTLIDPKNNWGNKRNKMYDNRNKKPFYILNEITTTLDAPRGIGKSLLYAILKNYENCWMGLTAFPHGEKKMKLNDLINFYIKFGFRSLNSKDQSIQGENMRMCMFIGNKGITYSGKQEDLKILKIVTPL